MGAEPRSAAGRRVARAKSVAGARVARAGSVAGARRRGADERERPPVDGPVAQMQHARLIGATVSVVDELGWPDVTVADIAVRARVSRRTFYDLFANREDCLLATLEDTVTRVEQDLANAKPKAGAPWVERVRTGLWTILSFLDRDPVLARVVVVQSVRGARRVLELREGILTRLARTIEEGALQNTRAAQAPTLTAEGLVGAAVAIVYKRLLNGERAPLTDLHGELMGMIVLPYLGAAAAGRERERPVPGPFERTETARPRRERTRREDPLREIPMRLTYRTARVLKAAGEYPGSSNRLLGEQADLYDQGQISKLLARLQRLGLLENSSEGQARGESNVWGLTFLGERVTEQLSLNGSRHRDGA